MNHTYRIEHKELVLRPLARGDIEQLRVWRNDQENSRYIRKIPFITSEAQETWFRDYENDPSALLFAICVRGVLVGSVALYDLTDGSASFGRLMVGKDKGCGVGGRATEAVLKIAFNALELQKIHAEVSVDNTSAIIIYSRVGFCVTGRAYNELAKMDEFALELDKDRFQALQGVFADK